MTWVHVAISNLGDVYPYLYEKRKLISNCIPLPSQLSVVRLRSIVTTVTFPEVTLTLGGYRRGWARRPAASTTTG